MMQTFEPVWISSVSHLQAFADILDRWPRWRMLLGFSAPMSSEFPQTRFFGGFRFSRAPLVMFACGTLQVEASSRTLRFRSDRPPTRLGLVKWLNLKSDVHFELATPAINSIDRYRQPRAALRYYLFEWVRVVTSETVLDGDFLLAVGNYGVRMGEARSGTEDLYHALIDLQEKDAIRAG